MIVRKKEIRKKPRKTRKISQNNHKNNNQFNNHNLMANLKLLVHLIKFQLNKLLGKRKAPLIVQEISKRTHLHKVKRIQLLMQQLPEKSKHLLKRNKIKILRVKNRKIQMIL
jgi:hypothetical protein